MNQTVTPPFLLAIIV